jgi:gliding motility-associated-like protein
MKNVNISVLILLILCSEIKAQNCDPSTPVFNVDLTGQPNGTWISPAQSRAGYCCGLTSGPNACVQFNLTLDSATNAISFDIYSGAVPGGSMFFQINCGPMMAVGQPLCLSGPGPYVITFCKPGNNANQYAITALSDPSLGGTQYVSQSCTGLMVANGLNQSSIQWTSVPANPTYNSYLNCTSGCDSVVITPTPGFAGGFIDYQVCGNVAGNCDTVPFCDTIRVNFVNDLSVNITPVNPTICFGGTNATVTANASGGLMPYNYLWSTGATTPSIIVGVGTYHVSVTDQMNCSIASDSVVVSALPSPITCNAGTDGTLCLNNTAFQLNGSVVAATGGLWSGGGTFVPSASTLNATYIPTSIEIANGLADLQLVTTGNFNCPSDTDYIHITVVPNPTPQITGPQLNCVYASSHFSTPFVSSNSYQWSVAGGTITNQNNNNIDVQWLSAGTNSVTLSETNSSGCNSISTLSVIVSQKPTPNISGATNVCNNGIENYTLSNYSNANSYTWSISNGIIIDASSVPITVKWTVPGTGIITVTEINSSGCDSTFILPVTISIQPAPQITGNKTVCNLTRSIYSTPFIPGNQYNWTVTNGTITAQGNGYIEVLWSLAGNATITLSEVNSVFCDSTITFIVTVLPQPVPVLAGPQVMCSRKLSNYSVSGIDNADLINWTINGGIILGSMATPNVDVIWTTSGQGELIAQVTNQSGCDSIIVYSVTILEGSEPELEGPPRSCKNDTCVYSVSQVQGHIYYWQVSGGNMILTNNNSATVLWQTAGTGTIIVTESTPAGCDSTVSMMVTVDPVPLTNATGSPTVCQNEPASFFTNQIPGNNYLWTVPGGTVIGSPAQPVINCSWPNSGQFNISLIETNQFGCTTQSSLSIQVPPKPNVGIAGNPMGCLNRRSNYTISQSPGTTYQYSATNGIVTSQTNGSIEVLWTSNGQHSLTVNAVNNTTGCQSQNTMDVLIDPLPYPVVDANSLSGCSPLGISFTNNTDSPDYHYTWSFGDGSLAFLANPTHEFGGSGSFPVKVIVTNNSGCMDSAISSVNVFPSPVSKFATVNEKVYAEFQEVSFNNSSQGAVSYQWNLGNGDSTTTFEPSVIYDTPGKYVVTLDVINSYGCRHSSSKTIEVIVPENVFIPNAFSPNGDTKNDYFTVKFHNIVEAHTAIYNRWGELIYQTNDMNFQWKGNGVQGEVYVYIIDAVGYYGTQIRRVGSVTVMY